MKEQAAYRQTPEQREQAISVHGGTHESPKHNIEQKKPDTENSVFMTACIGDASKTG